MCVREREGGREGERERKGWERDRNREKDNIPKYESLLSLTLGITKLIIYFYFYL